VVWSPRLMAELAVDRLERGGAIRGWLR